MRDTPKTLAAILLAATLPGANAANPANAEAGYVYPGSMEAQYCKGTVSGGFSGIITACGLIAEVAGGLVNYTFKFKVKWASGVEYEGGLYAMSRSLGEPVTGRLTHTAFGMGTSAHVVIPTRTATDQCMMAYGDDLEMTFGIYALAISRVPEPHGDRAYAQYEWLSGSIRSNLRQSHGLAGDPCPGVNVEAEFKPAR